ncbi:MAG: hypothetical protein R2766_11270 [Saprospiraceae bacterium]
MKLSILDLSIVPKNGDRHQALKNTTSGRTRLYDFGLPEHHAAGTALRVVVQRF